MRVVLAAYEQDMVKIVGHRRAERAADLEPRFAYRGGDDTSIRRHTKGAGAECAFAKGMGLYWPMSVDTFKHLDVPPYEVRHTPKVNIEDPPDWRVAWVDGGPVTWIIRGWIIAGEAQARFPATDPGERGHPAHFVPEWAWRPFGDTGEPAIEVLG